MGGVWSGCRATRKRTVESCDRIDTGDLLRGGLLEPGPTRAGSFSWRRGPKDVSAVGYRVTVSASGGSMRLTYQTGQPAAAFDYVVRLEPTPCRLGGVRWWFVCPLSADGRACCRRVRTLYWNGRYFGCRHCHQLIYRSTQRSDARVYTALRTGADLLPAGGFGEASVRQLGFALKVLTFQQERLDRLGRQPKRYRRPRKYAASVSQPATELPLPFDEVQP